MKKGLVAPGRPGVEEEKREFYRDVTINDAQPPIRHHLTKRSTQDDIARRTGTVLTVKGRYYPPGEPEDEIEKPLFLRVTPGLCLQDVMPPTPHSSGSLYSLYHSEHQKIFSWRHKCYGHAT